MSSGGRQRLMRREAVSMQAALGSFLRASGLGTRIRHVAVFQAWTDALGPELARRARPVRFERGELSVEVDSSTHHQELAAFTGETYRERANARLPRPEIARVAFRLQRRA